jgi:hypothetical protein
MIQADYFQQVDVKCERDERELALDFIARSGFTIQTMIYENGFVRILAVKPGVHSHTAYAAETTIERLFGVEKRAAVMHSDGIVGGG